MFIQAPTTTWSVWFMANIAPIILSFLTITVPAAAIWIATKLKDNHTATAAAAAAAAVAATAAQTAAKAIAIHSVDANQKLNAIEGKVDGAMTALTNKSNQQTADALADKDAQIARLKANQVPPNVEDQKA